ncbi:MAG: hypothetical protein HKN16_06225 [Saprospiraceae bacterium]|nr:hypothetical protein [Saprospiraceae bacterium]
MNTNLKALATGFVCSLLFTTALSGQAIHTITLNVNTGEIVAGNLSTTCDFGQDAGVTNEDFEIEVNRGDFVIWQGISSSAFGTDDVEISIVEHTSGPNLFGMSNFKDSNQSPGVVMGRINAGGPGDIQKYTIKFKVFNNGERRGGTFVIDPKIKVN